MLEESRVALILVLIALAISTWTLFQVQEMERTSERNYQGKLLETQEKPTRTSEGLQSFEQSEYPKHGEELTERLSETNRMEERKKKPSRRLVQEVIAEEQDAEELREWAFSNQIPWEEMPQEVKEAFMYDYSFPFECGENHTIIYLGDLNSERAQKSLEAINKLIWANEDCIYVEEGGVEVISLEEIASPDVSKRKSDLSILVIDGFHLQENPSLVIQSIENYLEGRRQSGLYGDGLSGVIVILGRGIGPIQTLYQYIDQIVPGGSEVLLKEARKIEEKYYPEERHYTITIRFEPSSYYPEEGYCSLGDYRGYGPYYSVCADPCDIRTDDLEGFTIDLIFYANTPESLKLKPTPPFYAFSRNDMIEDLWAKMTYFALDELRESGC